MSQDAPCPDCNGRGEYRGADASGNTDWVWCGTCSGRGVMSLSAKRKLVRERRKLMRERKAQAAAYEAALAPVIETLEDAPDDKLRLVMDAARRVLAGRMRAA